MMRYFTIVLSFLTGVFLLNAQPVIDNAHIMAFENGMSHHDYTGLEFVDFVMNPTYNDKNQIVSTNFSDLMRVDYTYNSHNQLEKKLTSYLDISSGYQVLGSYIYKPFFKTFYRYQNNRLAEERVIVMQEQMHHHFYSDNFNKVAVVYLKKYGYNDVEKVDTITKFVFQTGTKTYTSVTTLIYRNEKNRTEKIISEHLREDMIIEDGEPYFIKSEVTYDRNDRVIEVDKYLKESSTSEWKHYGKCSFHYEPGKLTCFYTYLEYHNKTRHKEEAFECKHIKLEVSYHARNQIVNQTITSGDLYMLEADYSYTSENRAHIESDFNLSELSKTLNIRPRVSQTLLMDKLLNRPYYRYTHKYVNDEKTSFLAPVAWPENNFYAYFIHQTYTNKGFLSSIDVKSNDNLGYFTGQIQRNYTYTSADGRNFKIGDAKYRINDDGQFTYYEAGHDTYIYEYDEYGFVQLEAVYFDDGGRKEGRKYDRYQRTEDGFIVYHEHKSWNKELNDWENSSIKKYAYYGLKKSGEDHMFWNKKNSQWIGHYKDSIVWSENLSKKEKAVTRYYFAWDEGAGQWVYKEKNTTSDYPYESIYLVEAWENNAWIPVRRTINRSIGLNHGRKEEKWDSNKKKWVKIGFVR